jgi:pimeloyl-ACP methyl ester carboxylesterase
MPFITTHDDGEIFYVGWGTRQPVVFSHGWPHLQPIASRGYHGITRDRRGHGRSSQTWRGSAMDTYADELAAMLDTFDFTDVALVGHSTGGAVVPYLLATADDPGGAPIECTSRHAERPGRPLRIGLQRRTPRLHQELTLPSRCRTGAPPAGRKDIMGVLFA